MMLGKKRKNRRPWRDGAHGGATSTGTGAVRTGVTASVFVLLAALLVSVGLAGGFLLTRSRIPQSLESSTPSGSLKVESAKFDDSRSVQLTVALESSSTVISPANGTVTASDCAKGAVIASGSTPFAVDATPLPALHTATPPYRRLKSGTQGPDARAINDALRALGHTAPDSDWFTWDSIAAWNAFADATGARRVTEEGEWSIDPSYFIWLPAGSVTVDECRVAVGRQVTQGMDLFATAAMPVKATLPAAGQAAQGFSSSSSQQGQQGTVAGDRILSVNNQDFPVSADATELTDPALMAAVMASAEYRMAQLGGGQGSALGGGGATGTGSGSGEGGTVQVSYQWRLATPIESITVPPASLYDLTSGGLACVAVEGTPTPVRVIASQLGKTMVTPDGTDPFTTVEVSPTGAAPCRG